MLKVAFTNNCKTRICTKFPAKWLRIFVLYATNEMKTTDNLCIGTDQLTSRGLLGCNAVLSR
jgi:hypothetical protein